VLLYYITHRKQFPGGEADQRRRLLANIAEAARAGIEYVQLREKDLPARALEQLAREAVIVVRENSDSTRLLINSRIDIALACGADGVHLSSTDIPAGDARAIAPVTWNSSATNGVSSDARPAIVVGVSTHSPPEVELAYSHGADFVVFGPVFEKMSAPARSGVGLEELRNICAQFNPKGETGRPDFPVLALGGVTLENARACLQAGASGIAAIRLFQENDVNEVVNRLRAL
jgi:thiamine-phosphate pyrophosphorylase